MSRLRNISNEWDPRVNALQSALVSYLSVEESSRQFDQSRAINRLTALGFIFLPMSFVASFFSMGEVGPSSKYWVYAATALPLTLLVVAIAFWHRWFRTTLAVPTNLLA